jgi:FecR-like protein
MPSPRLFVAAFALVAQAALAQTPASAPVAAAARVAGRVVLVEGDALHFDRSGALRSLRVGDRIYEGDRLITGPDGDLHIALGDGGYVAVRPGSEMRIDVFKADGRSDDRAEVTLLAGALRSVTGWIGPATFVRTPDAVIGVHGTDHEPLVVPVGAARGEPGTYDRVNSGATYLETPQGTVGVRAGEAAFVPRGLGLPAEVLRIVPALYRPTRNEGVFAGLNERIQSQLGRLRQERLSTGAGRADRPATVERADRPDRVERPERPDRPDRPDKADKPDHPDRPGRNK